jgi:trehalose-phosphatase
VSTTPADDLDAVVAAVVGLARPVLVGVDLDGTLSPLAPHRDEAVLASGALVALDRLAQVEWVNLVVLTGRGRTDAIERFSLPENVEVIGSHGAESSDGVVPADGALLAELTAAAEAAVRDARADGAWVERKPVSVTLHVRQADPDRAARALAAFRTASLGLGCGVLDSHTALEASPVRLDKGVAIVTARDRTGAASVCYIGDDTTDERVFERLAPPDVTVKVGPGPTAARLRLASPVSVVRLLERLGHLAHLQRPRRPQRPTP